MDKYKNQDRAQKDYWQYLEAMDAISVEKVASASVFFEPRKGNTIVDVGMASGTSSAILAGLFPHLNIIGIDINAKMVEIAQNSYQLPNLAFREDDGETLSSFQPQSVNGFFNCSSIHHITSYNGYDSNKALNTLRRQVELLKERGILVVRDFVKPPEQEVLLELSSDEIPGRPNDCELLLRFSREARSLSSPDMRGFPVNELPSKEKGKRLFRLFLTDATEFIRRKDYYDNWDIELQEEYGYFSQQEFEQVFRELGLRIIVSSPIYNRWIINNRYKNKFRLFNLQGNEIGYPPTNYLIAGEKMAKGKEISLVRHLPELEKPFLNFSSYKHKQSGEIYDLVSRPNEVMDIIPYFRQGEDITVLAKHDYPRPLANINTHNIDNKYYSGYLTECISVGMQDELSEVLNKRFGISPNQYKNITPSLNYYTSPGGINEKVSSYFVELTAFPQNTTALTKGFSGFDESGFLNAYDARQLLKTAQTGALPEARLELNIYNLFNHLQIKLPDWLGEKIELCEGFDCNAVELTELLKNNAAEYEACNERAGFLRAYRACFVELGNENSQATFEYVCPDKYSSNTLLTLPVNLKNGILYVGLEHRDLPVPQTYTGNSKLLTVPAKRLPTGVTNIFKLEQFIIDKNFGDIPVNNYFKLGEKYFSSVGVTTEQVYPYLVCLSSPTDNLVWVKASELFDNIQKLEDAHLLIALNRLRHVVNY